MILGKMLTETQKNLIIELRRNGREKIKTLAEQHNCPVSTMFELFKRMEQSGVLEHRCSVNYEKLGYSIKVFAAVKTDISGRNSLNDYLKKCKNVNSLHIVNNGNEFHFETIFKTQKEALSFLEDMEKNNKITEKNVYNVIDTIHNERFLTEVEHFE
jgi:DNA-binding Lrp family transcriptional regulator